VDHGTRYLYYQQALVQEMGPGILQDFMKFSLETALRFKLEGGWDALTSNLLVTNTNIVANMTYIYRSKNNI